MQKKVPAKAAKEWGSRRKRVRRVFPDRRSSARLKPDRRHGPGRRKEDKILLELLERKLSETLREAEAGGPENPRLATALNDLGVFYYAQGKYPEAEPFYKRALAIQEKLLKPTNPDVIQSLNNLAALYYVQGRYARAEPFLKRVLALQEDVGGPDHPDVAQALENYAELLKAKGRHDEAKLTAARAKAIRAKNKRAKSANQ
ncbi:MAG: tetratricopeptide repeat protein [Acidiferrobacterales bacterium]